MTTACCPPADVADGRTLPPALSLPPRWLSGLQRAWQAWREQSLRRAELRALEPLSDSTRRDIGLAERGLSMRDRALWDHERGLW